MQFLIDLWMPIVGSAVAVFFVSSIVHMVLGYHKNDYAGIPDEDAVLSSMRAGGVTPGEYVFPYCTDMKELATEPMIAKLEAGPIGFLSVKPGGSWNMGKTLGQWFVNCLIVSAFIGYLMALVLVPEHDFMHKMRIAGTTAFLAYSGCTASASIWKAQNWSTTIKHILDGVLYALATGAVFAWLWPGA